jgi:hypothetical protein
MKTKDIIKALHGRFPSPEWAFFTEFQAEPGFASRTRRMDAVAINCWPSGPWGHSILGFEVKVSKADFKKDREDPTKFPETYKICDRAYYVAPKGLLDGFEIPHQAGLIEVDEKTGEVTIMEHTFKRRGPDPPRSFLAAIARRCDPQQYETRLRMAQRTHLDKIEELKRKHDNNLYGVRAAKNLLVRP